MGKKIWRFKSSYPRLRVRWKGAPRDHIVFKGAHTLNREGDKVLGVGLYDTDDPKLAQHLIENVKEATLVEEIEPGDGEDTDEEKPGNKSAGRGRGKRGGGQ